jgi:hypothetical protein
MSQTIAQIGSQDAPQSNGTMRAAFTAARIA